MPIAVICPSCNSRLNAPDKAMGRVVPCPRCKQQIRVPAPVQQAVAPSPAPDQQLDFGDEATTTLARRRASGGQGKVLLTIGVTVVLVAVVVVVLMQIGQSGKGDKKSDKADERDIVEYEEMLSELQDKDDDLIRNIRADLSRHGVPETDQIRARIRELENLRTKREEEFLKKHNRYPRYIRIGLRKYR